MLSRNQIKLITSLQQKKFRKLHGLFLAEGERLVGELLMSNLHLHALFALPGWIEKNSQLPEAYRKMVQQVSASELERISTLKTSNQVLALFEIPHYRFEPQLMGQEPLLMLDDIQDPGNLGTIMRTADWFGIRNILCSKNTAEAFSPKTIQSSMGSIARVKIFYLDLMEVLQQTQSDAPVYGALLDGNTINKTHFLPNAILLIGNEGHGISNSLQKYITHPVYIPPFLDASPGIIRPESLNASMATAILCWEYRRQNW
ncbi:MAG: RNA methyltransferase [Bacteroidales bacterium]|nr:RNA methyltransferase [Bacteroidales bacterium]